MKGCGECVNGWMTGFGPRPCPQCGPLLVTQRAKVMVGDVRYLTVHYPKDAPPSFDAVFCDPPYGLGLKGTTWDGEVPPAPVWATFGRMLRPDGHLLAFGGAKTFADLIIQLRRAGFEIVDTFCWLYGTGKPKHAGGLKPGWEPVVLARKRGASTYPLNVSEGRGANERFRGNVILTGDAADQLDAQSGRRRSTLTGRADPEARHAHTAKPGVVRDTMWGSMSAGSKVYADDGGASRFFYAARSSRTERNVGLPPEHPNTHKTVKPVSVTEYLAKVLLPPRERREKARLLVPFAGSGSEMVGALRAGWANVMGIELDPYHAKTATYRTRHQIHARTA